MNQETQPSISPETDHQNPQEDFNTRLEHLRQGEEALLRKERLFSAIASLNDLGLSQNILEHLDVSSDETLEQSLRLAALAAASAVSPAPIPRAAAPRAPQFGTYLERAKLFQEDPAAYQSMVNNPNA